MFTSLKGSDIEKVFHLYDEYIFNNQIFKKIKEEGAILRFFAKTRTSGVGGMCGVKRKEVFIGPSSAQYYIDVAPNVLARLVKAESKRLEKLVGLGCSDRIYCLQLIIEHEIIHILMILWGYINKKPASIYAQHGKLYRCMLRTYFGHRKFDKNLGLSEIDEVMSKNPGPSRVPKYGLLVNWSSSCYLDSLVTSLLFGTSNFYRKVFFGNQKIEYHEVDQEFKKVCRKLSKVNTEVQTRALANKIRLALQETYRNMTQNTKPFKCINLRGLFAQCLPELKTGGTFTDYNVSEVYDMLTDLLPALKLKNIPATIYNPAEEKFKEGVIEDKTMFQMWDFLDPSTEGSLPLWREIDYPVLVFQNGLVPAIEDYSSTTPEKIKGYGPTPGKYTFAEKEVEGEVMQVPVPVFGEIITTYHKARSFGEYIIDGRYRLFAAIMNHGNRPSFTGWGGGHYTAIIRPQFSPDEWYDYDDLGPSWTKTSSENGVGRLPLEVFLDTQRDRPELLFYEKISDYSYSDLSDDDLPASFIEPEVDPEVTYRKEKDFDLTIHTFPDCETKIFIFDTSREKYITRHLLQKYDGDKISAKGYVWSLTSNDAEEFLREIPRITRASTSKTLSTDYGIKYMDIVPGISIYSFGRSSFVVKGSMNQIQKAKLTKLGGRPRTNLGHNLGSGFLFSRKNLDKVLSVLQ